MKFFVSGASTSSKQQKWQQPVVQVPSQRFAFQPRTPRPQWQNQRPQLQAQQWRNPRSVKQAQQHIFVPEVNDGLWELAKSPIKVTRLSELLLKYPKTVS